ncbi:MAG: response regulator transcription factor [Ruminococcus sp.]|nr:response regulator transcription factor [Ruminococcus sp.]
MASIMIIDDDTSINEMLTQALTDEGYSVDRAFSGTEALMLLENRHPDLILLDLMLPGLSGEQLLPLIKGIPVIVVSAKAETAGKVDLLLAGACDYVTKPFDMGELLARITVALRKAQNGANADVVRFADIALDMQSHEVTVGSEQVRLTRTEYAILKLLMLKSEQVVAKHAILDSISFDTPDCTEDSLKIHIHNLRRKLKAASGKDYIRAVWGIGFMLTDHSSEQ